MGSVEYNKKICDLLHKIVDPISDIDVHETENGWDDFLALTTVFAARAAQVRQSDLDQMLLSRYRLLRPFFDKYYYIEQHPLVTKMGEIQKQREWNSYIEYLANYPRKSGLHDFVAGRIEGAVEKAKKDYGNTPYILSFKTAFDDAMYELFKVKPQLTNELETDRDLQFFFAHILPGDIIPFYEKIFGSTKVGTAIRKFKETPCDDNTSAFKQFEQIIEDTVHDVSNIEKHTRRYPPSAIVYEEEAIPDEFMSQISISSISNVCNEKLGEFCRSTSSDYASGTTGIMIKASNYYTRGYGYERAKQAWAKYYDDKNSREIYITVGEEQKWLNFDDIHNSRITVWDNRKNTDNQFPDEIKRAIKESTLIVHIAIDYISINGTDGHITDVRGKFNLVDVFGEQYAEDALRIMLLLNKNRFLLRTRKAESEFDNLPRWQFTKTSDTSSNIFKELRIENGALNRIMEFSLEFRSIRSAIKFIACCVRRKHIYRPENASGGYWIEKLISTVRRSARDTN